MAAVSAQEIEAARTPAGGWTRATLAAWGVPWPPRKGWQRELIERGATDLPSTAEEPVAVRAAELELDPLEARARQAVAAAFGDFEAMNDPRDARAWR